MLRPLSFAGAALASMTFHAAHANAAIALGQFEPAPAGDVFFALPSPYARGDLVPRALLMFDYASEPLRLERATGTESVVGRQAFLDVNLSFAIQERLLVTALLPIAVIQRGDSPSVDGRSVESPSSAQIGDLRLGLRVRMFGDDDGPVQLGVGFDLHVPTAPEGSFAGEGLVREAPYFAVGGKLKLGVPVLWTATFGALVRSSENPSMLRYGGGVAVALFREMIQIGPEIHAATPLQDGTFTVAEDVKIPVDKSTNAELLLGVRARLFGGLVVGWAAGPGLSQAVGTPAIRFAGAIGWSPDRPKNADRTPGDTDGDGILDANDACPYAYGPASSDPKRSGCPVVDDDEDGVPNDQDACPDRYGPKNADPAKNGCPVTTVEAP